MAKRALNTARLFLIVLTVFLLRLASAPLAFCTQETVVTFDPAHTQVSITLDATAHTVHGNFKLKSGVVQFDPQSGKSRGAIVIDATSGDTDNSSRDKKMHQEVLESPKFAEISFVPVQVKGDIPKQGSSQVTLTGTFRIHGEEHPFSFMANIDTPADNHIHVKANFSVPYQKWGMKNPSNFLLHVGDTVAIEIDAVAQLSSAASTP